MPISNSHGIDRSTPARLYHGTRTFFQPGALIAPPTSRPNEREPSASHVHLTPTLDEAIWDAELAEGDGPPRVYVVEPVGAIEDTATLSDRRPAGRPSMSWRSPDPIRVVREFSEWLHYHGTRAALQPGDMLEPGHSANHGDATRSANHIYFARTLEAAMWGAELALGDAPGRIYIVEPTGPIEDDPNLTDRKFRGNPTKSFRSRHPLRVVGEVADWRGHPPEVIQAMKDGLARLAQSGEAKIDD
ncbi:MAG: NAD(+)--rifampin ADP-ribosyltransferase [Gemmatimonadota bacterium]